MGVEWNSIEKFIQKTKAWVLIDLSFWQVNLVVFPDLTYNSIFVEV